MPYKTFIHGKRAHSGGWECRVMCAKFDGVLEMDTYKSATGKVNYHLELDKEPTQKVLDSYVAKYLALYIDHVENPPAEPMSHDIVELIEKGIIKADTTAKSIDELTVADKFVAIAEVSK